MKLLKSFIFFIAITSIISCSDDDTPSFDLSAENIAATYSMEKFETIVKESVTSSGQTTDLSTTTTTGDTFQVNLILSANSTFTLSGEYRQVSKTTFNNGSPSEEDSEIIKIADNGNYTLNITNREITFTSSTTGSDAFNGTYKIDTFNENSLKISLEKEEIEPGTSIKDNINTSVTFNRS